MFLSAFFLLLSLPFSAVAPSPPPFSPTHAGQRLPHHEARLGTHPLRIMLARSLEEKMQGLMYFTHLDQDEGMLFVYPQTQRMAFWMKNTLIPLDLVFFNERLQVTEWIEGMQPGGQKPDHALPRYTSRGPARYALELSEGSVRRLGIQSGQQLDIPLVLLFSGEP
ncbi:MAG TPA: DUF192 domain-containing protein [Candidatus Ozemobacteraceae bacterium]|nr:DUF192 domain-containing protein [Candidatus Ozemobacteraceae bacterium]